MLWLNFAALYLVRRNIVYTLVVLGGLGLSALWTRVFAWSPVTANLVTIAVLDLVSLALAALSGPEQEEWRVLWAGVDKLLEATRGTP